MQHATNDATLASNVATGAPTMLNVEIRKAAKKPCAVKPTECLLRTDITDLDPVAIYEITAKGFKYQDVERMLSTSALYSNKKVLSRIVGRSVRTLQRQGEKKQANLNSQQSAVALQYAKVLEHAITVFGSQPLAEEWLGRPSQFLRGGVPLDMIDNPVGFQAVEDYLERIEYGVYQ